MAVTTTKTNKPLNPRGQDQSPLAFNRAKLYSGKALDFDGVNDSVNLDGFTLSGATATFVFNLKLDSPSFTSKYVFDTTQRWRVGQTDTANKFGFHDAVTWRNSIQELTAGEWYNISIVVDGTDVEFLWNGESIGDTFSGVNPLSWASLTDFKLGSNLVPSGGYLDGQIAGFKAFDVALTAAQVADLYNNPEKIVPTGVSNDALKLWLPMQEGAGTTAYDGSGNGNHGAISGATYTHGIGAPVAQTAVIDWNKGTNLLVYSERFDVGGWNRTNATITANATTSPDGQSTADEITFASSLGDVQDQFTNVANETHIASCWFKNGTIGQIFLEVIGGTPDILGQATINLATGTLSDQVGSYTPTIEAYADGWYRVAVGDLGNASVASPSIKIKQSGGNTGTFYVWGAQVEAADSLGAYIPNHTNTPITSDVLLPAGLTTGRDITGVNLFENVRKQGALNLDGNSWAEVHDNASVDVSEFTLEGWIYTNSITSDNRILSKWFSGYPNRTFQFTATNDDLYLYTSNGSTANNTFVLNVLSLNNWYHCVATYDGANLKIYLDGVLKATTASTITLKDSNEPVYIGAYVGSLDPSDNTTAQPRIYNRALTAEEVERNYNAGKNIYTN